MEVFCKLDLEVFKEYIEDGLLLESLRNTNTVDIVNHKFSNGYNKRTIKEEVEALLRDDFPEARVYMVDVWQLEDSEVSRKKYGRKMRKRKMRMLLWIQQKSKEMYLV